MPSIYFVLHSAQMSLYNSCGFYYRCRLSFFVTSLHSMQFYNMDQIFVFRPRLQSKQKCCWDEWLQWLQQILRSNHCVLDIWKQPDLVSCGTWSKMKLARSRVCWMRNKSNALAKNLELCSTETSSCFFLEALSLSLEADTVGGRGR